jgi:hypothetical protein
MVVEGKVVVCPQCGKKFKLKAGFAAKSFACPACSATVWVEGKPSTAPKARRSKAGARRRGRSAAPSKARAAPTGGRRGRRAEPPADEGEEHGRRRYQKQDNKSLHLILTVVGVIGCIGVGVFLFASQSDKEERKQAAKTAKTKSNEIEVDTEDLGSAGAAAKTDGGAAQPDVPVAGAQTPNEGGTEPEAGDDTGDDTGGASKDDGSATEEPTRKLGGSNRSSGSRRKNWAPPADLPHLEDTPEDLRKKIDELIALMMDWQAGRDSLDAKQKLVAIGKPAFPRILGAMAKIRDTITDNDSHEERLLESSLKLADGALREMDGYLDSHNKGLIRPGTDKKYIDYILKLHYRRWVRDLEQMSEMPGPYDGSQAYKSEADEDAKSGPK